MSLTNESITKYACSINLIKDHSLEDLWRAIPLALDFERGEPVFVVALDQDIICWRVSISPLPTKLKGIK